MQLFVWKHSLYGELMTFDDDLPDQCPPPDREMGELQQAYRVLEGSTPCANDWFSHMKRGKACPKGVDPCRWASISLQENIPAVQKLLKLPNFRSATHVAVLTIPDGVGAYKKIKNHLDFWKVQAANMDDFVIGTEVVRNG